MPSRPPAKAELHACPKLRAALRGSEAAVEQRLQRGGADSTAIAAELKDGAMGVIETKAKNAISLRESASDGELAAPLR